MASPVPISILDETRNRLDVLEKRLAGEALHSGGGGGTSNGMEARVAKLEADMGHALSGISELKTDVSAIRTQGSDAKAMLTGMDERIKALPTKEDVSTTLRNWILLFTSVIAAINIAAIVIGRFWPT